MFLIELFLLLLLTAVIVLAIRGGKPAAPEQPLIIHSPGQYHITLAPQLRQAQTFIGDIAAQFALSDAPQGDLPSLYLGVRDPQVSAPGRAGYLLAIARRGGMLYFQAINPQPPARDTAGHLQTLREFSEAVLVLHPLATPADMRGAQQLRATVDAVARRSGIAVYSLEQEH